MNDHVRSRSRLIGLALLAAAFVAGAATAVVAERLMTPRAMMGTRIIKDMTGVLDQLSLTPQQRTQAEAIIERSAPRTEQTMLQVAERLRSISDSVDAELRSILTSEQRKRLDSLRRPPTFMLRRKDRSGSVKVDTLYPPRRDTVAPE